jgi:hypothetical protein
MINFRFFAAFLFVFSLLSCGKDTIKSVPPITDPPVRTKISTKAEKIDSIRNELVKAGEEIASVTVQDDSTKVSFTVLRRVQGANDYAVFQPGDKTGTIGLHRIYPGMIINGSSFLEDGTHEFPMVRSEKDPKQQLIMEARDGNVLSSSIMDGLWESDVAVYRSAALIKIGEQVLDQYKSDPVVTIAPYATYQDIKDSILFTKRSLTTNLLPEDPHFEYTQDTDRVKKYQGVYVFFKQVYYTIKLDTTAVDWRLLANDISDSILINLDAVFIPEVA